MVKISEIAEPTSDIKEYSKGDFVACLLYDSFLSAGVVTKIAGASMDIAHFEGGFPFGISRSPEFGKVGKISRGEAFEHFYGVISKFDDILGQGGLTGAIAARKKHYLDGIIGEFKLHPNISFDMVAPRVPEPETGTYVVAGIYAGHGPDPSRLEGITADPRFPERHIGSVLFATKPEGFGRIPENLGQSRKSLVGYDSYEIPDSALIHVANPKKLTFKLDE